MVVTISDIKKHLRLGEEFNEDDAYLNRLIKTAISEAENYMLRSLSYFTEENGYSDGVPATVKHAILIKVGEYYDADRNGYIISNMKESKAFERLLNPYIRIC